MLFSLHLEWLFSPNVDFAKLFEGLAVRILSKITALPLIQYLISSSSNEV